MPTMTSASTKRTPRSCASNAEFSEKQFPTSFETPSFEKTRTRNLREAITTDTMFATPTNRPRRLGLCPTTSHSDTALKQLKKMDRFASTPHCVMDRQKPRGLLGPPHPRQKASQPTDRASGATASATTALPCIIEDERLIIEVAFRRAPSGTSTSDAISTSLCQFTAVPYPPLAVIE